VKIALIHDWLTGMRGGEAVLEALLDLYPDAEVFTLLHRPGRVSARIESRPIHCSFVDRLPFSHEHYRYYLPLFPRAIEALDLGGFDGVISTSHCVAKGVRLPEGVPHLCYCLTPMRYVWDRHADYFGRGRAAAPVRAAMAVVRPHLQAWDRKVSNRVRQFLACSAYIRAAIGRWYGRDARVVYPPVAVQRFRSDAPREDFYVTVSALVPYKRIELAVEAFNRMRRRLVVIGEGTGFDRLQRLAGSTVSLLGRVSPRVVEDHLARCRGFVYCAEEDFGIAPVEAQASGAPVVGYGAGGLLETVTGVDDADGSREPTGVFFRERTPEALIAAVERLERHRFEPSVLRANAERFDIARFRDAFRSEARRVLGGP